MFKNNNDDNVNVNNNNNNNNNEKNHNYINIDFIERQLRVIRVIMRDELVSSKLSKLSEPLKPANTSTLFIDDNNYNSR